MSTTNDLTKRNLEQFESNPSLPTESQKNDPPLKFDLKSKSRLSAVQETADYTGNASESGLMEGPFDSDFFNSKLLGFDLGPVDSTAFNPMSANDPFNSNIDYEKLRADKQSTVTKIGAMGTQFVAKTAVGVVGNIVGGFYALGAAAVNADSDLLFDNSVYRSLDEANESIEAKNSIFVNSKDSIGFNWKTAKGIKDAFEFIAGAVVAEGVMQTAGNLVGGSGITGFTGRAGRYIDKIDNLFKAMDEIKDVKKLKEFTEGLGTTVEEMARMRRNIDAFKASTKMARTMMTTTGYEASLEARGASDELKSTLYGNLEKIIEKSDMSEEEADAYRKDMRARIDRDASSAGLATFLLNTALLSGSNLIQFPGIFGSKYASTKQFNNIERAGLGTVQKKAMNKYLAGGLNAARILKSPVTEFFEETGQGLFSTASKNYYETMLSTDTDVHTLNPGAGSIAKSVAEGLKETYGTEAGLEEGIIGAIVGAIGLPGFKKAAGKSKFSWQGGLYGDYKDIRDKKRYTEEVIDSINSSKLSEGMLYARDNAVRASLDTAREDLAIQLENPIEHQSVQDNKVFRYTQDRLKRGLDDHIKQDISELEGMASSDIDKYRKTFGKDESFTKEDAVKEVEAFKEKVDTYSKAYNKVNKAFRFSNYSSDSVYHNKLNDVLTHSLAASEVWGKQLDIVAKRLYEINSQDFTPEQIDKWAQSSLKVAIAGLKIEQFKEDKQAEKDSKNKRLKKIRESEFAPALDKELNALKKEVADLEAVEGVDRNQATIDGLKDVIDAREKAVFNFNKSKEGRRLTAVREEALKEANIKIKESVSRASKELGQKPVDELSMEEVYDYFEKRKRMIANLNKVENTSYKLDAEEYDNDNEMNLLDQFTEIVDRFRTTTDIAASLYGFRKDPSKAYSKILSAEFYANLSNVQRKATYLTTAIFTGEGDTDETKMVKLELEHDLEQLKAKLQEYEKGLPKEVVEHVEKTIGSATYALRIFKDIIEKNKEAEKQDTKANSKLDSEIEDGLTAEELANSGIIDDPNDQIDEKDPLAVEADKKNNRLVIKDTQAKKGNPPRTGNLKEDGTRYDLQDAIEKGLIKNKAASTLELEESQLDPEKNSTLKARLKKDGISIESYNKGMEKVKKSPKVLTYETHKLDDDVYNFITYAPIVQRVYDKVATRKDKKYVFEIDKANDKVVFEQFLFSPDNLRNPNEAQKDRENNEKYELEKAKIEKTKATIKAEQDALGTDRTITTSQLNSTFDKQLEDLYLKYKAISNNTYTLLNMRKALLANYYGKNVNELKLKVHNVDQGDFQNFRDANYTASGIEEHSIEDLGVTAETLQIGDILYGNKYGQYYTIDGKPVKSIGGHPLINMSSNAQSGKIYIIHTDKSGRKVPVQMNTSTISKEDGLKILKVLEAYLLTTDKKSFKVTKSGITFLDNRAMSMRAFMDLFIKNKENQADSPVYLKNTYELSSTDKDVNDGDIMLKLFIGNVTTANSTFKFPKFDGTNKEEVKAALEENKSRILEQLMGMRRPINKKFFIKERSVDVPGLEAKQKESYIDVEALDYLIKNKVINHPFDTKNNFDKIYKRDPNRPRHIVISRADIEDTGADDNLSKATGESFGEAIKRYRNRLGLNTVTKDGKGTYEANASDMASRVISFISSSMFAQRMAAVKAGEKFNISKAINKAIDNFVARDIALLTELTQQFQYSWDPNGKHDEIFTKQTKDKLLDTMLRNTYAIGHSLKNNKQFIKQVKLNRESMEIKNAITNSLKRPGMGSTVALGKLNSKDDKMTSTSNIKSQEQVDSIIEFFKQLELMHKVEQGSVHINYNKQWHSMKGESTMEVEYNDPYTNTGKLEARHKATEFKSIVVEEEPVVAIGKDGKPFLKKGKVWINVGTVNKDGKFGNDRLLLMNADGKLPLTGNSIPTLVTSVQIPTALMNHRDWTFSDDFINALPIINAKKVAFKDMLKLVRTTIEKLDKTDDFKPKKVKGRYTAEPITIINDSELSDDSTEEDDGIDLGLTDEDFEGETIGTKPGTVAKDKKRKSNPKPKDPPSVVEVTSNFDMDSLADDMEIDIAISNIKDIINEWDFSLKDKGYVSEILKSMDEAGIKNSADVSLILKFNLDNNQISKEESEIITDLWNDNNKEDQIQDCE